MEVPHNNKTDALQVLIPNAATLAVVTWGGLKMALEIILVCLSIAFTIWQWRREIKTTKTKTDKHPMRKTRWFCLLIITALILTLPFVFGCVTRGPATVNANGTTNSAPVIPNTPAISNAFFRLAQAVDASAPVNPYAAPVKAALPIAEAAALSISGLIAWFQNRKAKKSDAVAQTLATGIVAAGAQQSVLNVASSTPHFAAVAEHLNEATP